MNVDEVRFDVMDRCDCCRKKIAPSARFVAIVKFPDGGCDSVCIMCYRSMTSAAIAWYSYNGNLPVESPDRRLERARKAAEAEKAITVLEGILHSN